MAASVPLFRAALPAGVLDTYLEPIDAIAKETPVHFEATAIRSAMTDPAGVAQVEATLGAGAFETYGAPGADHETPTIGVTIGRVRDVCGKFAPETAVELAVDATDRQLRVGDGYLEFSLGTIDPSTIRAGPDGVRVDRAATATIEAHALARAVRAADVANADEMGLAVRAETGTPLVADAAGVGKGTDPGDDVAVTLGPDDPAVVEAPALDADATVGARYSLDYLRDVLRPIPADAPVKVAFGDGTPVELRWRFEADAGAVAHRIAPRKERTR